LISALHLKGKIIFWRLSIFCRTGLRRTHAASYHRYPLVGRRR
jgi:hypothetical protein